MKPFLIYLGQPRAGSTWLYGALKARGDAELGPKKEHFYFQNFLYYQTTQEEYWAAYDTGSMQPNIKLLGDMTPSNGYATVEQIVEYKNELDKRGFVGKPVLTLRDPTTHLLSLTQFNKSIAQNADGMDEIDAYIAKYFDQGVDVNTKKITAKTVLNDGTTPFEHLGIPTWRETVTNWLTVFGEVYIQFYEQMFCEDEMLKLFTTYLGVEYLPMRPEIFDKKVFSFNPPNKLTKKDKQKIHAEYPRVKENYEFAVEMWGQEFIDSIWFNPNK